ncbi:YIF1 domain-containing protein [Phanerochaete sordida]|uniref:Protein YIF1 n=1 Tax=Phanerochaete sordida TaxID=48140 RepID=A0A9P3GEL2_9APHY|nr:YIF1 domain-containing protein [Phanerochaete sordida]
MSYYNSNNRSPPPLQHPVPTHPAYIPEPPSTPASPQGYQRYTSSPQPPAPYAPSVPTSSHIGRAPQAPSSYVSHGSGYPPVGSPPRQQPTVRGQVPQPNPAAAMPVDFSAWGFDDATAQFGMQMGQNAVTAGQNYVQKQLGGLVPIPAVKHHFKVSNSYVVKKLALVLFPWRHKPWARRTYRTESGQAEWLPPRDDINSPDLYIPVMALVTYILLAALHSGLNSRFHPEILGVTASKALAVVLLDFVVVKGGCYFLNIQGPSQVLDLLAYGGYKFVGVILTLVAGLLNFGRTVYIGVFLYSFFATFLFLLRSLRSLVLPDASATASPVSTAQRSRRITFLFLIAASQLAYMGMLVRV